MVVFFLSLSFSCSHHSFHCSNNYFYHNPLVSFLALESLYIFFLLYIILACFISSLFILLFCICLMFLLYIAHLILSHVIYSYTCSFTTPFLFVYQILLQQRFHLIHDTTKCILILVRLQICNILSDKKFS